MKHIVIVGGSWAGVCTAHRILKQGAKTTTVPFKITLVSRDSHFYWSIASPRGLLPDEFSDDQLFRPIADGFAHYPADRFEFLLATATGIDIDGKQLEISHTTGATAKLDYDYLILGMGSRTKTDTPFKSRGSTEATKEAIHEYQERIQTAKSIVVVGAGPTGVEMAGELAFKYGQTKEVMLISSGPTVLEGRPDFVSRTALKQLQALKVDVRLNTKVKNPLHSPDGRHEVVLSADEKLVVDMVIPTYGVVPNSSFLPSQLLDDNGFVKTDAYFSVEGAEGVFALGDVSNVGPPQFLLLDPQSVHLAKNMVLTLSNKLPLPYKAPSRGVMGLQIGKKTATGHFGMFRLPSFVLTRVRKTLFVEKLSSMVDGSGL
ncbi:hypothetical protein F4780DRAFT_769532 [Xylariomycetidae sp. FL0641]|nr:hypothetical protein F4780DRAFT_769532 [Xylariomycetidae sp. FL0641]